MLNYLTAKEISEMWGITPRRVAFLCENGRVPGAERKGYVWLIPADSPKPVDGRTIGWREKKRQKKAGGAEQNG